MLSRTSTVTKRLWLFLQGALEVVEIFSDEFDRKVVITAGDEFSEGHEILPTLQIVELRRFRAERQARLVSQSQADRGGTRAETVLQQCAVVVAVVPEEAS